MLNVPVGVTLADSILTLKLPVLLRLRTCVTACEFVFSVPKSILTGVLISVVSLAFVVVLVDCNGVAPTPLHAVSSNKEHSKRRSGMTVWQKLLLFPGLLSGAGGIILNLRVIWALNRTLPCWSILASAMQNGKITDGLRRLIRFSLTICALGGNGL